MKRAVAAVQGGEAWADPGGRWCGNGRGFGGGRRGGGGAGMGGGGGATQAPESIFYVKSDSDKYQVLPFAVTVLIDQDRVQDFLIELENSKMSIQVKDFELLRPIIRVSKPEKGDSSTASSMMGLMGGGRMGMGSGMMGMGGQMQSMMNQIQQQGMMRGGAMAGAGMGMGGGMGQPDKKKQGKNVRDKDVKKEREEKIKAINEARGPALFDVYFDIVQVKVYGQARFFNAPPADAAVEPSSSQSAAPAATRSAAIGSCEGRQDGCEGCCAGSPRDTRATEGSSSRGS